MAKSPSELVGAYIDWLLYNKGKSSETAAKYHGYLDRFLRWAADYGVAVEHMELNDLEEFTGRWAHNAGLSPSSRRPLVAALRGFYAYLKRAGYLGENPANGLQYPTIASPLPNPIQLHHAEKVLMQCNLNDFLGLRDAAILSVLIGCGCRISGAVGLNDSSLVFIPSESGQAEQLLIKVVEKGKKERLVPAPSETRLYLRAYLGHSELEEIPRSLPNGDAVLFVTTKNRKVPPHQYHGEARRISSRTVADMIVTYGERAGVPRSELHPHAFRHRYGTELHEGDVDVLRVQALLGHADANTSKIYVRTAMRKLIKEVDRSNPFRQMNSHMKDLATKGI